MARRNRGPHRTAARGVARRSSRDRRHRVRSRSRRPDRPGPGGLALAHHPGWRRRGRLELERPRRPPVDRAVAQCRQFPAAGSLLRRRTAHLPLVRGLPRGDCRLRGRHLLGAGVRGLVRDPDRGPGAAGARAGEDAAARPPGAPRRAPGRGPGGAGWRARLGPVRRRPGHRGGRSADADHPQLATTTRGTTPPDMPGRCGRTSASRR